MVIDQIKAKELFLQALDRQQSAERDRFLCEACGDDLALREQVDVLLIADARAGSFLEQGAVATIDQPSERIGTLIGRYKLLEQVGEGGMGVVYVAEQTEPVRRRVALKIIKPGMDTKQVIARFEAERQALAMMDHANIARVLDAGTTEAGRPYFVMELVRGMPITEYCDKARLSPRQRLELFVDVCQAVQHAHQKGIIHRDLKPSNVMVTTNDGRPVVKVIDFGVAKAVGQQLTERTVYTALTQLVGTPLYMSPEQAELTSNDVDTRSDIYSLGVLLYELLTGQTPFDKETLAKAGLDEMRRIIREDEPLRPSRRFSTLGAQASSTISQRRSLDERHLSRVLRGELDWIVMKALEKDRSRRYESASALATDIQRYLSDEPVLACPPTTMYRFQKFARKHKPALATAAAIALCLILGTTVSAWQAARATTAEAQANANEAQAKQAAAAEAQQRQRAEANEQQAKTQRDEAQRQRDEIKALHDKLAAKEQQLQRNLYASNMNLAKGAWDSGNIQRVTELLDQHRPKAGYSDLRGFEWHYLNRLCHSETFTIEPLARIAGMAYSPDGKRLATALYDQTLKVWDVQTGKTLLTRQLDGSSDCVAYSTDGKRLAFGSNIWDDSKKAYVAYEVKVCDAQTGGELLTCKGHTKRISSVAFSPDGKRLASGSGDGTNAQTPAELKIWDAQTGEQLLPLNGHISWIASLVYSPNGELLASVDSFGSTKVWDTETGRERLSLQTSGRTVAFSPDGKRLASGKTVWDAQIGTEILSLKGDEQILAFSPDGKRLAGTARCLTVWDAETGGELLTFKGHMGRVRSVIFSSDGKRLISNGEDPAIKVWDTTTSQEARTLREDTSGFRGVSFSPDGKRLAVGARGTFDVATNADIGAEIKVLDSQTGQELMNLKGHDGRIYHIVFSPDGKLLASGSGDKTVKIWDAQTGRKLLTFTGHTAAVVCVAFSPDSTRLVSCSSRANGVVVAPGGVNLGKDSGEPGEVVIWDVSSGHELVTLKGHSKFVNAVAYSPDGTRLATLSRDQTVKIWNAKTGDEIRTLKVLAFVSGCLAFSPDGKRLASSNTKVISTPGPQVPGVKVWDVESGEELFSLHSGVASTIAYSPDGERLITCSGGGGNGGGRQMGALKVWDAQTGQELLTLNGHNGGWESNLVALSPDAHRLVGGGQDGTIKIWDATPLPEKP